MVNLGDYKQVLKKIFFYAISASLAVLLGLSLPDTDFKPDTNLNHSNIKAEEQTFTRAEYERLEINMPLYEVESILGRGVEISSSANASIYIWKNSDNSGIKAKFEKGKLIYKEQFGF